jgi:hypothetical protein
VNLSEHVTLEEMTRSQTALRKGMDNTAPPAVIRRMEKLARDLLEPIRALLGVPLQINSGYRCDRLNRAVGGSRTSQHMTGDAADIVPIGLDKVAAFHTIRTSDLLYNQLIEECGATGWIHVAQAFEGALPKRQVLYARGGPGAWTYTEEPPGGS